MNKRMLRISGISCMAVTMLLASCAQDGFDDKERFQSTVTNSKMKSPDITAANLATVVNPDGTESVKVTWNVVPGAGGYLSNVAIVDDPANPVYLMKDSIIDGCSFVFDRQEDTYYEVSVKTLGEKSLNNTDADEATVVKYDSFIPSVTVPTGTELSAFVAKTLAAGQAEQGFILEPGATYTLDGVADCDIVRVDFRGDKNNHPTIIMGENGAFMTQAGLKIKNLNIDCAAMSTKDNSCALIKMSNVPNDAIRADLLGYNGGNAAKSFVIEKPIIVEDCWIKDLGTSLIWGNDNDYNLMDFRIENNIIQLHFGNSLNDRAIINMTGVISTNVFNGWKSGGMIYALSVKNNTIYNTEVNTKGYVIRYPNASNSQPSKILGSGYTSTHKWVNNTLIRTTTGKDFGNNIQNGLTWEFESNIWYDTFRVNKYIRNSGQSIMNNNLATAKEGRSVDGSDLNNKDKNGNPFSTLDDAIEFDYNQTMDFSKPNAGVNFKPSANAISKKVGDPRWF